MDADLRPLLARAGLTARDQTPTPLCWAFGATLGMEIERARVYHDHRRLSVTHLVWAAMATDHLPNADNNFGRVAHAVRGPGMRFYDPRYSVGDGNPLPAPPPRLLRSEGAGVFLVHWIRKWSIAEPMSPGQKAKIDQMLAAGRPVVIGMRWPNDPTLLPGFLLPVPPPDGVFDGHVVTLIGRDGDRYLFRNSYGTQWGDGGDGWLTVEYLERYLNDAISFDFLRRLPLRRRLPMRRPRRFWRPPSLGR